MCAPIAPASVCAAAAAFSLFWFHPLLITYIWSMVVVLVLSACTRNVSSCYRDRTALIYIYNLFKTFVVYTYLQPGCLFCCGRILLRWQARRTRALSSWFEKYILLENIFDGIACIFAVLVYCPHRPWRRVEALFAEFGFIPPPSLRLFLMHKHLNSKYSIEFCLYKSTCWLWANCYPIAGRS